MKKFKNYKEFIDNTPEVDLQQYHRPERFELYRFKLHDKGCNLKTFGKYAQAFLMMLTSCHQGSVVNYDVSLLGFRLYIIVLNRSGEAPIKRADKGKGSFGSVRTELLNGKPISVKRQYFTKKTNPADST